MLASFTTSTQNNYIPTTSSSKKAGPTTSTIKPTTSSSKKAGPTTSTIKPTTSSSKKAESNLIDTDAIILKKWSEHWKKNKIKEDFITTFLDNYTKEEIENSTILQKLSQFKNLRKYNHLIFILDSLSN